MTVKRKALRAAKSRQHLIDAVEASDAKQVQALLDRGVPAAITDASGNTLLQLACRCDAAEACVLLILASGVDIEGPGRGDDTALQIAVRWAAEAAVQTLLAKGASVHATDSIKRTPLHWAQSSEIVTLLLDNGADIEARDRDQDTPLNIDVKKDYTAAAATLLQRGASVSAAANDKQITPLHSAQSRRIIAELLRYGADIEARDRNGNMPLHDACRYRAAAEVKAFIVAGAKLDVKTHADDTPLHIATFSHYDGVRLSITEALVAAGARLDTRNKAGQTAYDKAFALGHHSKLLNLLRPAAMSTSVIDVEIANNAVSQAMATEAAVVTEPTAVAVPSTINTKQTVTKSSADSCAAAAGTGMAKSSNTMLIKAATTDDIRHQQLDAVEANDVKQLQSLLDSGASTAITDDNGNTLLQIACRWDAAECVQVLLVSDADIEATDAAGRTALHTAVGCSSEAAVKIIVMLLTNGASVCAADSTKETPLHYAKTSEVVTLLLDSGADIEACGSSGQASLHIAAKSGSTAAVKTLLQRGVVASPRDSKQLTPLHYAKNSDIIAKLLEHHADIEARDNNGDTPLVHACHHSTAAEVNAFIEAGADLDAKDDVDNTLLHVAIWNNSSIRIVEALVAAGARLDARNDTGQTAYDNVLICGLDSKLLNLLRPAAVSSSVAHVEITSNADSEAVAADRADAVAVECTSATGPPTIPTSEQPATVSLVDSCAAAAGTGTVTTCSTMSRREAAKAAQSRQQLLSAVEAEDAEKLQSLLNSGASTAITDDDGIHSFRMPADLMQ
jgi:ankyrin repeat protein